MLIFISTSIFLLLLPYLKTSSNWIASISSLFFISLILILKTPFNTIKLSSTSMIRLDFISIPLIVLTLWISALIILARYQIKFNYKSIKIFLFLILLLNTFLVLSFSAASILIFYIFFEATLIPTLLIIIGWGYQPERLQAGFYLIIYTILASLPLLISITIIFTVNNTLSIAAPFFLAPCSTKIIQIWWIISILAFIAKIPIYTMHLWLPKAHVEAPVAGSMILAGLLLKLGSYGILRIAILFPAINRLLSSLISSIALWGAVITRIICLRQPDIKSLIAYSSVGHIGILTAGIMSNSTWGWERSLTIIIAHGLCSSSIFALANIQYESTQTRNIFLTKGLLSLFPIITLIWFITCSANMAAPTSLNLIAEIILMASILSIRTFTIPVLIISAFLAGAYSLFLYTSIQHGAPSNFINPIQLFTPRNYLLTTLHLCPLFILIVKLDITISWLI